MGSAERSASRSSPRGAHAGSRLPHGLPMWVAERSAAADNWLRALLDFLGRTAPVVQSLRCGEQVVTAAVRRTKDEQ